MGLVRKLRTCPAEEREAAALELAKEGSDDSVRELMRMAEGRHRKGLHWYSGSNQFLAIEALALSGNPKALEFLDNLINCRVSIVRDGHSEEVYFPKARKALNMDYTLLTSEEYRWHDSEGTRVEHVRISPEKIQAGHNEMLNRGPYPIIKAVVERARGR